MTDDSTWFATLDRIRRRVALDMNAECRREHGLTLAQTMVLLVLLLPSRAT